MATWRRGAAPGAAQTACVSDEVCRINAVAARQQGHMRVQYITALSDVDAWGRTEWQAMVEQNDILLITPQLFLDAVTAQHLFMGQFCALAFDQCQHCIGSDEIVHADSHPHTKIVHDHVNRWCHMLGLCTQPFKKKHKDPAAQTLAMKRLTQALHANVLDCATGSLTFLLDEPRSR
jgi:hypothetical protein